MIQNMIKVVIYIFRELHGCSTFLSPEVQEMIKISTKLYFKALNKGYTCILSSTVTLFSSILAWNQFLKYPASSENHTDCIWRAHNKHNIGLYSTIQAHILHILLPYNFTLKVKNGSQKIVLTFGTYFSGYHRTLIICTEHISSYILSTFPNIFRTS